MSVASATLAETPLGPAPAALPLGDAAAAASSAVAAAAPTDTYFSLQWYLQDSVPAGLHLGDVWDDYTGQGVVVAVMDTGIDGLHVDLDGNYDAGLSIDAGTGGPGGLPVQSTDNHGTAVAGIIAAERNGTGVVGVAYDATLISIYDRITVSTVRDNAPAAFTHAAQHADVMNNSWTFGNLFFNGPNAAFADDFAQPGYDAGGAALAAAAAHGRDGLGTVVVFAAGNAALYGDDVNLHSFTSSRFAIAVAAGKQDGTIASYSSHGAAVLVTAPGSEPAGIATTDRSGAAGYSNGDYIYFSGTSAAAPMVSGVAALMLEANPLLGYRDVQAILAYSARLTDAAGGGWQTNGAGDWNGGGLFASHIYGFGLVDAHAAVRLAESWRAQSTEAGLVQATGGASPGAPIPDGDAGGVSSQIAIADDLRVEHVEVDLQLSHTFIGQLVVTLTSPSGTSSVLLDRPGAGSLDAQGSSQDDVDFVFTSVQHWGESAAGTWTLTVQDLVTGETGSLDSWSLTLSGASDAALRTYVYTDAFGALGADPGRSSLVDADGGPDALNCAAVSSDTMIDIPSALAVIAGRPVTLGGVFEWIYTGDGDDTVIGGGDPDWISGGRGADELLGGFGDDTILGGAGADTMYGGPGDDLFTVDGPADRIWELRGQGYDRVEATGSCTLGDGLEALTLLGAAPLGGTGNAAANLIYGNGGANLLRGGAGNDSLNGGAGNDTIAGEAGRDLLTGSGGLDHFRFAKLPESGVAFAQRDVINTFAHGDKIDVSAIDASSRAAGNQAFTFVAAFTGVAGQLQWDQTTPTGFLLWGDVDGDGAADFSLQVYGAPGMVKLYAWDLIL